MHSILNNIPENPNQTEYYLFYLHGLIIEEAGIRPNHPEFGYYEYELILETLSKNGFTVISEVRAKGTEIISYAERVAKQIKTLINKGVPPGHISLIGASKGGAIGAYVSKLLNEKQIHYVILAGLFKKYLVDDELHLTGNVLSIHDRADKLEITPDLYFSRSNRIGRHEALVVEKGIGHGLVYKPYKEWLHPAIEWIKP